MSGSSSMTSARANGFPSRTFTLLQKLRGATNNYRAKASASGQKLFGRGQKAMARRPKKR
jgi:hypothetical protein